MSPKTQFAIRFDTEQVEAIALLSNTLDCTVSDVVRGHILPEAFVLALIGRMTRPSGHGRSVGNSRSISEGIQKLIAEGLVAEMIDYGVDPSEFEASNPDQIAQRYVHFVDAVKFENGLIDGPSWHFETPPAGGFWEREGVTGMKILPPNVTLTPGGFNIEGKEVPAW